MKPSKGSKFLGSGPLRTALGWWKKRGQRECLEVGALWWAAGVHKVNTQRERELGGGHSIRAYCMCKGPEYLYLGKTFHINKFSS